MKRLNKKGFTLTEMIVVIAIIGILAGVLIPTITGYIKRANRSNDEQLAASMTDEIERYCIENNLNQNYLIGTDIRTILIAKGYNLKPSHKSWTYVYNAKNREVELKDVTSNSVSASWDYTKASDPSNFAENLYLVGEGSSNYEKAVQQLLNYNNSIKFNELLDTLSGEQRDLINSFNPNTTVYINNVENINKFETYTVVSKVVFTVGTYNLPNLVNSNITNDTKTTVFNVPQIITSVNEQTKNRMSTFFVNMNSIKENKNFKNIDLSSMTIKDGSVFYADEKVDNSTNVTIDLDVYGYTDRDIQGIKLPSIKIVYQVTVIYFNDNGITAKGTKLLLSDVPEELNNGQIESMYNYVIIK